MTSPVRHISDRTEPQAAEELTLATHGALVDIHCPGTVHYVTDTEIVLTSGITIPRNMPGMSIDVRKPGFRRGDVVHNGRGLMMRVDSGNGVPFWMSDTGATATDTDTDPTRLRKIAGAGAPDREK